LSENVDFAPVDLMPATGNHPIESVRYQTVVLTGIPGIPAGELRDLDGPVDLAEQKLDPYDRPGEGMIVTTEQTWTARGVTLGRLLHSLALAPGESTRVAVVDWERRTKGSRNEAVGQQEELAESSSQNRSINEIADSVAREQQHGHSTTTSESSSSTVAGSLGLAGLTGGFGIQGSSSSNKGIATSVSRSSGSREVAARTAQEIAARTQQLATASRSRQAMTVEETSQSEGEQVTTRVVTNYNHMHAMTVQYYEVVQSYEVATRPVLFERCLFIPLKVMTFTRNLLKRYAPVLADAALPGWRERIGSADLYGTSVSKTASSSPLLPAGPIVDTVPGRLRDISATPGAVWGVLESGDPVRWNATTRGWDPVTAGLPAGGFDKIAAGKGVWALSTQKEAYYLDGNTWQRFLDRQFRCIAVGADGSVFAGGRDEGIFRVTQDGSSWEELGGDANDLAVVNRNRAWHIWHNGKTLSEWNAQKNEWEQRPGELAQIAAAADGAIWGVNVGGDLFRWAGTSTTSWAKQAYPGADRFSIVAPVSENEIWAVTADGSTVHIVAKRDATGFDLPVKDGDVSSLTVHWDDTFIRGFQLGTRTDAGAGGETHSQGNTDPGLRSATHSFVAGERLKSVVLWVDGQGVRQIELTTTAGATTFGTQPGTSARRVALDVDRTVLSGLFGEIGTAPKPFLASLGCYVRGETASAAVLDHLNDNTGYYSQVIWADADDVALGRVLSSYRYGEDGSVPLGLRVDPRPVAITANYLAFRWHFGSEEERQAWLAGNVQAEPAPAVTVGLPTAGVFAEAVLGRANAAEKIDLTRFWNWKDSPIPILPPEISPVGTGSRARDMDLTATDLAPVAARISALAALPSPAALDATLRAVSTANMFRDMSGLSQTGDLLSKSLAAAAASEQAGGKNATEVMKIATDHFQKMADMAIKAAPMLLGPQGAALTGLLGGGSGSVAGALGSAGNVTEFGGLLNSQLVSGENGDSPTSE
jgi:hypothetical protein